MDRMTALLVFREVVRLGSFAEAARELSLSPAAISKNIAELEAKLGVRLLNRTTRRMSLTEAGSLYFNQVAPLLDDLDAADRSVGPLQHAPRGVLRVSAPVSLSLLTPISSAIPRFLEQNPGLSVDLRLDDRQVNIVEEGFDVAIRAVDALDDSSLVSRKLMTTPHIVCGAPAYFDRFGEPSDPAQLREHNCVLFTLSGHPDEWSFQRHDRTVRVRVDGRYRVSSSLAVRDALCAGFGLSLIPRVYVQKELEEGRLRTVLDTWAAVDLTVYDQGARLHRFPRGNLRDGIS
jgi:DNA-binding transcriptional LysR family regulator